MDDILLETEAGWIFVQAKTSLTLSSDPRGELGKATEQIVRLWLACSTGDGSLGWNRPLQPDRDRVLLAVGSGASRTLSADLAQGLAALQATSSAPLSKSKRAAVRILDGLLEQALQASTGLPATKADIGAISSLVTILTFDFDGADRQTATEILSQVLEKSDQASTTFSAIAMFCQGLMRQRTGCDMPELRRALTALGVPLTAPPSFRADVASLRSYSEHVWKQLSDYEATKVAGVPVRIERQCTEAVVDAARAGSLLLVGEPGAGKSAVINAAAMKLRNEGHDVLELAVDRLPVKSLPELAAELGLSHPLRDVLLNWPGAQPAFLFIDALDATRGGENEGVFRTLIDDVLSFESRQWHVIASIRTFDLRLGEQFRRLFNGRPPNDEFSDAAFPNVTHVHIPPWTPAELRRVLEAAPTLATAIDAGGDRLRELALVPFNTRLLADLISGGLVPSAFGDVESQVQLLGLYWNNRVERHGTGAELCLQAAVTQMIEARSLRARKLDAARPDATAFDALLHENVLVQLKQEQFISFRHHILFDYAASRVYLHANDLTQTAGLLTHGKGLGLMLAPALAFALQALWNDSEPGHRRFWGAITRISGDPACDPVARSVAARTASELPRDASDAVGLLVELSGQGETKNHAATALSHVVGSLVVRFEDAQPVSLDPWCELAAQASEIIQVTVWPLRTLLYVLYERISTDAQRMQLGRAARQMLVYSLASNARGRLTASAIEFVATTYASDIGASRHLLRRLFEPGHFQDHADQEIPWLARSLKPIGEVDPEFVADIYAGAFGATISDDSKTSLGDSQILPLSSNRRQDYEGALWTLTEFFPQFLNTNPVHAARALVKSISGYVARIHPVANDARAWTIHTPRGDVRLLEDQSYMWAWDVEQERGDNAHRLIKAFVDHLGVAERDVARSIINEIVARNELGVLWSRSFLAASKRAEAVGDLLWPIAVQQPFLESLDTQKDAIDFIAARYPFEETASRVSFESAVVGFKFQHGHQPERAREAFLSTLFACLGEANLATGAAREFLSTHEMAVPSGSRNARPFTIVSRTGSPEKWWWLQREGVDLSAPDVVRILTESDEIRRVLGLQDREEEIADVGSAITRLSTLVDAAESTAHSLPDSVTQYAYGIAAQGAARLSRLPLERLREQDWALASLIALVIRLAEAPAESPDAEAEERFESSASWGSPNAPVDTADAVMQLCRVDLATVEQLRSVMEVLLGSGNPAARMQIAEHLTALWSSARSLMWELAERVARTERNRGVLRFFANYFLGRTIHADPERVERLSLVLYKRDFVRAEKATQSLFEEIGTLLALLWISHGRTEARSVLKEWIADPHTFEAELSHAIAVSRGALVLKYTSEDLKDAEITRRAQEFYEWAVETMADGLERYLDAIQLRPPTDLEKERGTRYAKLLNQLCDQIYFASGAFRTSEGDESSLLTDGTKRAFLTDIRSVLARIADVGTPGTVHHLIELLDYLVAADPGGVFDLVAHALLGAGRRHRYQFESLGADRFVEIVGHYLADHRELFADEQRRQKLVECLDTFMEAGWPAARRLLYRLPELLQ